MVPARVLASGARTVASPGRTAVISRAASASDEADGDADEDDTSKLIVACAIGLATGLGVALFNVAEHATHDLVFVATNLDPRGSSWRASDRRGPRRTPSSRPSPPSPRQPPRGSSSPA